LIDLNTENQPRKVGTIWSSPMRSTLPPTFLRATGSLNSVVSRAFALLPGIHMRTFPLTTPKSLTSRISEGPKRGTQRPLSLHFLLVLKVFPQCSQSPRGGGGRRAIPVHHRSCCKRSQELFGPASEWLERSADSLWAAPARAQNLGASLFHDQTPVL